MWDVAGGLLWDLSSVEHCNRRAQAQRRVSESCSLQMIHLSM